MYWENYTVLSNIGKSSSFHCVPVFLFIFPSVRFSTYPFTKSNITIPFFYYSFKSLELKRIQNVKALN